MTGARATLAAGLLLCCGVLALVAPAAAQTPSAEAVERGRYLAQAGDCVACHTAPRGKEFAGGRALATPLGAIYSTNITPDRETGIGGDSLEDFTRALREGIDKRGNFLYPAMPYPSYTKVTDADIKDLYAYFQDGVAPVRQANRVSDIPYPLSLRFPLFFWDAMFLHRGVFQPEPGHDAQWNRGAYLVEGLGHCGACHTPRALTLQEKAMTERDGADFLAGAVVDGWYAKSLRGDVDGLGRWSEADIVAFLKTGSTERTAAFAAMAEVVQHSTQYMTDDDLAAIARFLKSLPPRRGEPTGAKAVASADQTLSRGKAWYEELCVTCHRADGQGVAHIFPALAGNDVVQTADATSLVHLVFSGGRRPLTTARPNAFAMPAFKSLDDREVAEIVSYIRSAWGNGAGTVSAEQVAKMRASFATEAMQ